MTHFVRKTNRREFIRLALVSPLVFSTMASVARAADGSDQLTHPDYTNLKELLTPFRADNGLPAIAAGVMRYGVVVASGAVGLRKVGARTPVTILDKFHLGSCTKAMTATLAAKLVEHGKIQWSSTLAGIFPERAEKMHPSYRKASLELLLTHRAGVPRDSLHYQAQNIPMIARRLRYLDSVVEYPPESEPNTQFSYSNAGYVIVGAMLERVTGRVWEDLMRDGLFRPLGMSSAGFGSSAKPNQTNQPWGHKFVDGKYMPNYEDGGPVLGPPGRVHCTILDCLKFADFHASNGERPPRLLNPVSLAKLHPPRKLDGQGLPAPEGYAMGWSVIRQEWANGLALTHQGSNGANLFVVWIGPSIGLSVALACNAAGGKADVLNSIAVELALKFAK